MREKMLVYAENLFLEVFSDINLTILKKMRKHVPGTFICIHSGCHTLFWMEFHKNFSKYMNSADMWLFKYILIHRAT